jgi:hypothetical protein
MHHTSHVPHTNMRIYIYIYIHTYIYIYIYIYKGQRTLPTHTHTHTHTHSFRKRCVEELQFDRNLEFDSGDVGPSGGVQMLESAFVRAHPKYVPDRIIRRPGAAMATDPWPDEPVMTSQTDHANNVLR